MKSYLKFEKRISFGVLSSPTSNVIISPNGEYAITAALENIILYNLNTKLPFLTLSKEDCDSIVTCLALAPDNIHIISGHEDGTIRIWDYHKKECMAVLHGHKSRITSLCCDPMGRRLVSASFDTDIVFWDLIIYGGLFRLRGHHQPVTHVEFYDENTLISCSVDSSLKVWELDTQHCAQTVVGHSFAVHTFALDKSKRYMVSGGKEMELFVWEIVPRSNLANIENNTDITVSSTASIYIRKIGNMTCGVHSGRKFNVSSLKFNKAGNLLFALVNDIITLFYVHNETEMLQKRKQRLKKRIAENNQKKEKGDQQESKLTLADIPLELTDYLTELTPIRTKRVIHSIDICTNANIALVKDASTEQDTKNNDVSMEGDNKNPKLAPETVEIDEFSGTSDLGSLRRQIEAQNLNIENVLLQPILCSYNNNSIGLYQLAYPNADEIALRKNNKTLGKYKAGSWQEYVQFYEEVLRIENGGHRTSIRSVSFSSDDSMVATVCSHELKIWNTRTQQCIRSIPINGYALKCLFVSGNKHVVVATKEGRLLLYDLVTSHMLQSQLAHDGPAYTIDTHPNKSGLISGGGDSCVKFWSFDLVMNKTNHEKELTLKLSKVLKVQDEALYVRYSPNAKYIAVALLDCTIQLFFADSLKFYLTLYGHKLPVFGMDISSDSQLLISGSADKNIKIWGLDHGDCHKSIFAHSDSIMCLQFVPNTHYFFSGGKDKAIKYWDGDKFRKIQEFANAHKNEIWGLCINSTGQILCSAGGDRNICMWMESNEPLFPLEEERKELESKFDENIINDTFDQKPAAIENSGIIEFKETDKPTRKNMDAVDRAEYLLERMLEWKEKEAPKEQVTEFMYGLIRNIPVSQMEEIVLILPFENGVDYLLGYLMDILSSGTTTTTTTTTQENKISLNKNRSDMEKCIKLCLCIVQTHYQRLMGTHNTELYKCLKNLSVLCRENLNEYKRTIGYNLETFSYLQDVMKSKAEYIFGTHQRDKNLFINEKKDKLATTWTVQNAKQFEDDDT